MGYTVHLFAHDAQAFADRLKNHAEEVLERTRAHRKREGGISRADLDRGIELAGKICRGELPKTCSEDEFWAVCWMADTELERIALNVLISVKRFSYIEQIGLWPLLDRWAPPFSVPRAEQIPPGVGFLPHAEISTTALPFLKGLPNVDDYATDTRRQFMEVLESLDEDNLDLLAIVI